MVHHCKALIVESFHRHPYHEPTAFHNLLNKKVDKKEQKKNKMRRDKGKEEETRKKVEKKSKMGRVVIWNRKREIEGGREG